MSAIRPDLPAALQQPTGAAGAARSAQAAFFQTAMSQVQSAPAPTRTALQTVQTPVTTTTPTRQAADPARSPRPGSLLDIRV